jgi:5'-deoxynucleotidase
MPASGGRLDSGRAVLLSLYHDAAEIFTGDLPTPVKYYSSEIRGAYRQVEEVATGRLLSFLPQDLQPGYEALLQGKREDEHLLSVLKAADKLSALIKCVEEEKAGNSEFKSAAVAQEKALRAMNLPEVDCFLKEFLPAYRLTLDEQDNERGN